MKYLWTGPASGITAYARTKQRKDIRLATGRLVEIPEDDPNLNDWITNQLSNGNLVEQQQ